MSRWIFSALFKKQDVLSSYPILAHPHCSESYDKSNIVKNSDVDMKNYVMIEKMRREYRKT